MIKSHTTVHQTKQAEKLKSHEKKEGWMKNDEEWWWINEEWWRMNDAMKDDDFKLLRGFDDEQMDGQHLWM